MIITKDTTNGAVIAFHAYVSTFTNGKGIVRPAILHSTLPHVQTQNADAKPKPQVSQSELDPITRKFLRLLRVQKSCPPPN